MLDASPEAQQRAGLTPSDLVSLNGEIWVTPHGNAVVDPRSDRWRHYLYGHVMGLKTTGYDGIFLDTVEDATVVSEIGWLGPAVAALMADIVRPFQGRMVIQNNGIFRFLSLTLSLVTDVCVLGDRRGSGHGSDHAGPDGD